MFATFIDLPVGSSHRRSNRKDFDRTHKVDHLAMLGTTSLVSLRMILMYFVNKRICNQIEEP